MTLFHDERFQDLVRDMKVGVLLQGPGAEILLSNPTALEYLGLSEDQLLGKTSFDPDWNCVHDDGSAFPGPSHPVPRAIATGQAQRNVIMGVYRPAHGDRIWLSVDAIPQMDSQARVEHVVCTFTDISERKEAEDRVKTLLAEKELILREVHHRVKNNLGTIMSLLSLQAESLGPGPAQEALQDARGRVLSMEVLYEKLYRDPGKGRLGLGEYLPDLVREIIANFPSRALVEASSEVEDLDLDPKRAQVLGIIVNELLTNAMKYAFAAGQSGRVWVRLGLEAGEVRLEVGDDGQGMAGAPFQGSTGFGLRLVESLAGQLGGRLDHESGAGTRTVIHFPL